MSMPKYQILRRKKNSNEEWLSTTSSTDWDYISEVFRIHTTDESLNEFEFKMITK